MSTAVKDIEVVTETIQVAIPAPELNYEPRDPALYRPGIALIGCGGIAAHHLRAYRSAGYRVCALCDPMVDRAIARRDEYFPSACVTKDYREILDRDDIAVVDVTTHPAARVQIIEDALNAGKHVLSQKPFVLDLAVGEHLVNVARENNVLLAVNQNGRWAPHMSYMREAVRAGLIGDVLGVHVRLDWDHTWTKDTVFEEIDDLILYDFAIHWFDFLCSVIPDRRINRVFASKAFARGQDMKVPMLAQAMVDFDGGQASLVFDAHTRFGQQDTTYIAGSSGSISSAGPSVTEQTVRYFTKDGVATPTLSGAWFPDGFHGTMAELLSSIESTRVPLNSASENLRSLSLAFAAIASANERRPIDFGDVTSLWASC
jgi:predicted dehydrogenase